MKGVRISEEHFEAFYKEFSKQLKTMKVGIKVVSAILKKVNLLRDEIISSGGDLSESKSSLSLEQLMEDSKACEQMIELFFINLDKSSEYRKVAVIN